MKLKQLYSEFIKIYMSKDGRIVKADFEDENEKFDWFTDGYSIWAIPKDHPFNLKIQDLTFYKNVRKPGLEVVKVSKLPSLEHRDLLKLETSDENVYMYVDEKKLKWYDKGFELKIYSFCNDVYRNICQVYEDDELRGLILGVRVNEEG
ncbi:hypothetical protein [Peptoniphilus rhinitidis]|uniref:hypothetical protein n=1 Tax=Peptoniphilus rhinitidis TaxID=1175452 RepID=UPI00028A23C4|nr:hypothetical protein [Peptoniphilus rhinitidis]